MKIKFYNPSSPGRRFMSESNFRDISARKPEKKLVFGKKNISGRDNTGKIVIRFRGGGHKRRVRIIDFKRNKYNVSAKVISIEYDPNRSARISLLHYIDGEKKYVISPRKIKIGQVLLSGKDVKVIPGNSLPIQKIPLGTLLHNIELRPKKGGQLVRSAGTSAQLLFKEENYASIKMPSGEHRKIHTTCYATIGQVSNPTHGLKYLGKAGKKRWLGYRPHNRGVSMNPVDHPLGGGEGKTSGGRHPASPWGKPTKGFRTKRNKRMNYMIVKQRFK